MGHVVKHLPWCVIDVDTDTGAVFIQQRWKYNWLLQKGQANWTSREKQSFHNRADRAIWAAWSNRVKLKVSGTSPLANKLKGKRFGLNLDVRWVLSDEHWIVNATKVAAGDWVQSNVEWERRVINLDTEDFAVIERCNDGLPRQCNKQVPVAHEFGHAAGNTAVLARGDEYRDTNVNVSDKNSIMNIGDQLRNRHFKTIIEQLNLMIPDTTFEITQLN